MTDKLKKASVIFWIISAVAFLLALWGSAQVCFSDPGILHIFYVIPTITIRPLFYETMPGEELGFALCYVMLIIPVIFASIAIVLRMIAKAFVEQTITTIEISNQN